MKFYRMLSDFQDNFGEAIIPPDILMCAQKNNDVLVSCGFDIVPVAST